MKHLHETVWQFLAVPTDRYFSNQDPVCSRTTHNLQMYLSHFSP
jgi:hypothetical protein